MKNNIKKEVKFNEARRFNHSYIYFEFSPLDFKGQNISNFTNDQLLALMLSETAKEPRKDVAARHGVTSDIDRWYETNIVPLLDPKNVDFQLARTRPNSDIWFFRCVLKESK